MSDLSLYVHFPWCVRKCPYCDFNSHPVPQRGSHSGQSSGFDESAYIDALLSDLHSQLVALDEPRFSTVFCGGGTPSLFTPPAFERFLGKIAPLLVDNAEITLEANPGTTEHHDLRGYRSAGINRLSFGAQSFDDTKLKALGRIHDSSAIYRSFDLARRAGFDNINLDLMYGLPEQTRSQALQDLECAITLEPEHLSWYQLTVEAKTEFARRPPPLPGDLIMEAVEDGGFERLEQAGFNRYEVSAYTSKEAFRCRHNLQYWTFGDYLGIGAGAHGKLSQSRPNSVCRTRKAHQPRVYLQNPEATIVERVEAAQLPGEFMLNALRLKDGVAVDDFESSTGLSRTALEPSRGSQIQAGLLEPDRLQATPRGYALLDSLIQQYF